MSNSYFSFHNLKVTDHSVSGDTFVLLKHQNYDILETTPQPTEKDLPAYYESEDYISHTDAKRNIFERIYVLVKSYMLKRKANMVVDQISLGQILDIGAGTGDFVSTVKNKKQISKVIGVEPNSQARDRAKTKGLFLEERTTSLADHSFDAITMWHVLEHIPNIENQVKELDRLLKQDGKLFIAVPNFKSHDAQYYGEFWAALDVPRHLWHFSAKGIVHFFDDHGFELIEKKPMWFDAFYVSLLSEKYKNGKMNMLKAIYVGLKSNIQGAKTAEYSSIIYVFRRKIAK